MKPTATINKDPDRDKRHPANRAVLQAAIIFGYTHCLKTRSVYHFFHSQRALDRKRRQLGHGPEDFVNGRLMDRNIAYYLS